MLWAMFVISRRLVFDVAVRPCSSLLSQLSKKYSKSPEQVFFRFVRSLDITILSGTTSTQHLADDLAVLDESFVLDPVDLDAISKLLY